MISLETWRLMSNLGCNFCCDMLDFLIRNKEERREIAEQILKESIAQVWLGEIAKMLHYLKRGLSEKEKQKILTGAIKSGRLPGADHVSLNILKRELTKKELNQILRINIGTPRHHGGNIIEVLARLGRGMNPDEKTEFLKNQIDGCFHFSQVKVAVQNVLGRKLAATELKQILSMMLKKEISMRQWRQLITSDEI